LHIRNRSVVNDKSYHPSISGEIRYSDNGGFSYFWPNDLPFEIQLDRETERKMEKALMMLSKLDASVSKMSKEERDMLLVPFMLMESTKSSAIEGTKTTVEDLYLSERMEETDPRKRDDNKEVLNYKDALDRAISSGRKDIDEKTLLELHNILMKGVRGENKSPGKYRTVQVFVGSRCDTLETARFVPMPPEQIEWKIGNLIEYINDRNENALLCAAMSHYQFETIHPFTDGNGRMGRLLIMLILNVNEILTYPILYLSDYFNERRSEYIDKLSRIRECDDFGSWVNMFLDALIEQSERSIRLIDSLFSYREELRTLTHDPKKLRLIDSLFVNPYVRNSDVADICEVHFSTAARMIDNLVDQGVLRETTGRKRNQLFICQRIMDILNSY